MANKFYVIGRPARTTGIGEIMCGIAAQTIYAHDNDFIPVVDMKHYINQYFKDGKTYKENSWEYYFEQPSNYNIDSIDGECIISKPDIYPEEKYKINVANLPLNSFYADDERINNLKIEYKKNIKFNKETMNFILEKYNEIINPKDVVLGVLARGTDYTVRKTRGEQIQPKTEQIIKKVKKYLKLHQEITKIYIATEDEVIYQSFKKEFGEILLDNNQYRYTYKEKNMPLLSEIKTNRPNHNYTLGLEYLSSLYILSKCKYFIGGRCAGSKVAWILSDGWKDCYIWDIGIYGKSRLLEFSKNIFQLINVTDKNTGIKYKIITILGIKIKLKKKNPRI